MAIVREIETGDVIRLGGVVGHVVRIVHTPGGDFDVRIAMRNEQGGIEWRGADYCDLVKPPVTRPPRRKAKPATNTPR